MLNASSSLLNEAKIFLFFSIGSPCQCTGSPASAVILLAADPFNVVLGNYGSDDWKQQATQGGYQKALV
jgi:hypothetical protein